MRGRARRNLVYMRTLAAGYPDEITQQPVARLPRGHITVLLDKVDDRPSRDWYAAAAVEHGWSRNVLAHQIATRLHARVGTAPSNFAVQLPAAASDLAQQLAGDPYVFDFLALTERVSERELETALMNRLQAFLRRMWWHTLIGVLAGLLIVNAVLLGLLWRYARQHPDTVTLRDALRLLPDLIRLLRRLAADKTVPIGVRVRLVLLLAYLASPIDIIPDFIPVIGYADDAIVVALVLRSVARRAGPDTLAQHWPGSSHGPDLIRQLAGLPGTG